MCSPRLIAILAFASVLCLSATAKNNPHPFLNQSFSPASVAPGSQGFTLTLTGTGFVPNAVVLWNGTRLVSQIISSTKATASIPSSMFTKANTASVFVANPGPGGGISNVVYFPVTAFHSGVVMRTSQPFAGSQVAAVGDFNRDGKLDVAWYNGESINLSLGNGDGTFKPANSTNVVAYSVLQLITGDFNDDGKLDVVALERVGSAYYAQLYFGDGDGKLTEAGYAGSSGDYRVNYIAAADLNGDGYLDLYVTGDDLGSQWFSIFLGDGRGNFTQRFNYTVAQVAGYGAAAIGDFNGDGILDLAVPNDLNFGYEVFLGNGDGSFGNPISTGSAETAFPVAADMNGDGILDLVDGGCIQLGNGDGTFQYPGGDQCEYNGPVEGVGGVGDFDGDRNFDAALTQAYPAGTAILLGDGKGDVAGSWTFSISATNPPAIGDFNNDGKLDLVLQNGYVLQQIGPTSTPPR